MLSGMASHLVRRPALFLEKDVASRQQKGLGNRQTQSESMKHVDTTSAQEI